MYLKLKIQNTSVEMYQNKILRGKKNVNTIQYIFRIFKINVKLAFSELPLLTHAYTKSCMY